MGRRHPALRPGRRPRFRRHRRAELGSPDGLGDPRLGRRAVDQRSLVRAPRGVSAALRRAAALLLRLRETHRHRAAAPAGRPVHDHSCGHHNRAARLHRPVVAAAARRVHAQRALRDRHILVVQRLGVLLAPGVVTGTRSAAHRCRVCDVHVAPASILAARRFGAADARGGPPSSRHGHRGRRDLPGDAHDRVVALHVHRRAGRAALGEAHQHRGLAYRPEAGPARVGTVRRREPG
ncbi:hypothetical protein ACFPRL_22555 [Pseudoclavibacter helvolus]